MPFEAAPGRREHPHNSVRLAEEFRTLDQHLEDSAVFEKLEQELALHGFSLGDTESVGGIFEETNLICRNETFTKVLDLIIEGTPIDVLNRKYQANMCKIAHGEGFRVAMSEGFGGADVGGVVRTVLTFRDTHLTERDALPPDAEIWKTKPRTAQVSFAARGEITMEDLEMVSFRFPVRMFPEKELTESEQEQHENSDIQFVVRHYLPTHKKATH